MWCERMGDDMCVLDMERWRFIKSVLLERVVVGLGGGRRGRCLGGGRDRLFCGLDGLLCVADFLLFDVLGLDGLCFLELPSLEDLFLRLSGRFRRRSRVLFDPK